MFNIKDKHSGDNMALLEFAVAVKALDEHIETLKYDLLFRCRNANSSLKMRVLIKS